MSDRPEQATDHPLGAAPVIKQRRSLSIVWLIPLVALIIGGWLAYKAITEKGPVVTVTFRSADGLEAGKTKVKFKSVEVGVVEKIAIGEDLNHVRLSIRMDKGATPFLTDQTKFWVVRARITASEITGLGTLLGGAYIGVEPSSEGEPTDTFIGLEKQPIVSQEMSGTHFMLSATRLGSLSPGSPIYFRQIKVGKVVDYELEENGNDISLEIFIDSPYDQFVRENTRFWIASGLDLQLTANGLRVDTESMVTLMIGGIAFNSITDETSPAAAANSRFVLYEKKDDAFNDRFESTSDYYIEFFDSVRGLSTGAPVEFRGFQLGTVTDMELISNFEKLEFSTMVKISIVHDQISIPVNDSYKDLEERLDHFVKGGLRAQLKTGNLLSGQLFVDLAYFDDVPASEIKRYNGLSVLPSIPAASQSVMNDLSGFLKKLNELPLQDIATDLKNTMLAIEKLVDSPELVRILKALDHVVNELNTTIELINSGTLPQLNNTFAEIEILIKDMDNWVSADSPLYDDLRDSLRSISEAARSINDLTDMLSRHPEALIKGKSTERQQ